MIDASKDALARRRLVSTSSFLALALVLAASPLPTLSQAVHPQEKEVDDLVLAGISMRKSGDYEGSIRTLDRALSLAKAADYLAGETKALQFLSLVYRLKGDYQKVLELRLHALEVFRRHAGHEDSWTLGSISAAYVWLKDYPSAARYAGQALDLAQKSNEGDLWIARQHQRLGIVLFLERKYVEAEAHLSAAHVAFEATAQMELAAVPGPPRDGIYEPELSTSRWLQEDLIAQQRPKEALEVADQTRSRVLSFRIGSSLREPSVQTPLSFERIAQIAKSRGVAIVEYSVVYRYDPDLLLEFSGFSGPADSILIWVVRPNGSLTFKAVDLTGETRTLSDLVGAARASIRMKGRGVYVADRPETGPPEKNPLLAKLHGMLVAPLAEALPHTPDVPVVFIPQDSLALVPFAALQDERGRYLIESVTPVIAGSIDLLRLTSEMQSRAAKLGRGVLVVGNPDMPVESSGDKLPSLPGAALEASQVATLFGARPLLGKAATKESVLARMPSAKLIHLATHGLIAPREGWHFNSLALTPSGSDAGFLTVREIERLHLSAELAVLSACDTGVGELSGEGVLGFSRAFFSAGVPSLVVSLWSIPDQSTAALMGYFYAELQRKQGKAQALRVAMLRVMKSSRAPAGWAAFELLGEFGASPGLQAARGDSPPGGGAGQEAVRSEVTFMAVPAGMHEYHEFPRARPWGDDVDIIFQTPQSLGELVTFYRNACLQRGLHEVTELTDIEAKTFSLVFRGKWKDRSLVIQGTDMSGIGSDRTVSMRFEPL